MLFDMATLAQYIETVGITHARMHDAGWLAFGVRINDVDVRQLLHAHHHRATAVPATLLTFLNPES